MVFRKLMRSDRIMLEIKIKKVNRIENETGLFCLDDCIATVAAYYNQDYELMYAGGYEIMRRNSPSNYAQNYMVALKDGPNYLWKYHGLKFQSFYIYNKRRLIKRIQKNFLNKKPVLVIFDPYWCPWDMAFQKHTSDTGHCFFLGEVTEHGFNCIDPYFEKECVELPYEYFWRGLRDIFLCVFQERKQIRIEDYQKIIEKLFKNLGSGNYFNNLKLLTEDMQQSENIFSGVLSDETFWVSPLATILLTINQSMQNIANTIFYIAKKLDDDQMAFISKKIWKLAIEWKQVRKLIIKLYFIKRDNKILKNSIFERMGRIVSDFEKIVLNFPNKEMEKSNIFYEQQYIKEYYKKEIDLEKYKNNKAFLNMLDLKKDHFNADFSSVGNCFIWDEKNDYILDDRKFASIKKAISKGQNDNIACNGQRIVIQKNIYSEIVIIGAAEFGNSSDILKLIYKNQREYELEFRFTDYIYEPQFNETVVWRGKGICTKDSRFEWMHESLYLYEQRYIIPNKELIGITLPINPSIHIFGITLICGQPNGANEEQIDGFVGF